MLTRRTFSRCGADCSVSRFSTNMMQPPKARGRNSSNAERSKLSEVENSMPRSSSADKSERPQDIRLIRLRCPMPTPLGRPVEPDV